MNSAMLATVHVVLWSCVALFSLVDGFTTTLSFHSRARVHHGQGNVEMTAEEGYLNWLSKKVQKAQRPPYVKISRPKLSRDFAVLLMRSSYQVPVGRWKRCMEMVVV